MSQTLLEMAKDLVLAQIQVHRLSPEDMSRIHKVRGKIADQVNRLSGHS